MPPTESLPQDALILCFDIPFTEKNEYVQTYRIARRPQMAHPIVNAGFRVRLDSAGKVEAGSMSMIYGGLATMIVRFAETEKFLEGKEWNDATLKSALPVLQKEALGITVPMDEEGITTKYRLQLAETFFYKFFLHTAYESNPKQVKKELISAAHHDVRSMSHAFKNTPSIPKCSLSLSRTSSAPPLCKHRARSVLRKMWPCPLVACMVSW